MSKNENQENENYYSAENILKMVPAGVFWKDAKRRFVGANQMFLDYYGLESVEEIVGKTDEDVGWHIDPGPFKELEWSVIKEGKTITNVRGECIVRGQVRQIVASKQPLFADGKIVGLIGFFNDVTDMIAERDKLEQLSNTDELTQLPNRRAFSNIVQKYVSQYYKEKTDFVMFMIDIDKFKQINDKFGHDFGDQVLIKTANIIRSIISNNSVAFRIGGDEFSILHQYSNPQEIINIHNKLIHKMANLKKIDEQEISVSISIGMATFSESDDILHLTKNADKRMYEDKQNHS